MYEYEGGSYKLMRNIVIDPASNPAYVFKFTAHPGA